MKIKWLFAMLCCTIGFAGFAQSACTITLTGLVLDEHDGSVLSFSNLWIPSLKRGAVADIDGNYRFENLCEGQYEIVVSHIGCEPDTVQFELKDLKGKLSFTKNFQLEHHTELLETVEISEQSKAVESSEVLQLSNEKQYQNEGKPLGEMLKSLNGVNALQTGSNISKPVINGFSGNRVQIVNQGIQFQSQQWGDEHAPEIDPFAASNYKVIKGAGAVKYSGGALGGLVVIEPRDLPSSPGIRGEFNSLYATNNRMGNTSLMLEGNSNWLPQFGWRLQGSWKRSGNIKTPNYYQKNTGVKELNGSADFGYRAKNFKARLFYSQFNSEIGIFSGAHIGNLTDLRNAINRSEPRPEDREGFSYEIRRPYQRIIHELVKAELNWTTNLGILDLKLSRQFNIREEYDKERPRNNDLAALNLPEFSLGLESYLANLNWRLPQFKRFRTEVGVEVGQQNNSVNSVRDFIPDYNSNRIGGYLLENWKKNKWALELGIRVENNSMQVDKLINRVFETFQHDFFTSTITLGGVYSFQEKTNELRMNLTYSERPPAINELYSEGLHHGSASLEYGDNRLGKEKSMAWNISYQLQKKSWRYKLYAYLQYVDDFIYLDPTGLELTIRGAFPAYQWRNTDALIRGVDQSVNYDFNSNWSYENRLSLLWGNNLTANNFLINMPANRIENEIRYRFQLAKDSSVLTFRLEHQYVLRQERFNPEEEIAPPPTAYSLLNAGINYQFTVGEKHFFQLGVEFSNLLNERYRTYLNRFRFYTDEQGRNGTIKLKYKF